MKAIVTALLFATASAGQQPVEPTLTSAAPVASGIDVAAHLQPAWGTGAIPAKDAVVGAFRFLCAPSHLGYDDPIVYPGRSGASHLHDFFGNTATDAGSTYVSLRTTGEGTCNNLLNRSAYWIPAMMNGRGKVVRPNYLSIYYKRRPASDPECRRMGKACVSLPRGLRYVFGYNMQQPGKSHPSRARWWNCAGDGAVSGHFATIAQAAKGCPVGALIEAALFAPECWNGRDLDSPDHRAHMAYAEQDGYGHEVCPKTHPYVVPQLTEEAFYENDGTAAQWFLSSDAAMPGMAQMPGGSTLHADWFGAWDDDVLALWIANCIDQLLSCSGGDLGNGQQLKALAGYTFPKGTILVDPPVRPQGP